MYVNLVIFFLFISFFLFHIGTHKHQPEPIYTKPYKGTNNKRFSQDFGPKYL